MEQGAVVGREGVAECGSEVTGTEKKVRGHQVAGKRMAMNVFEEEREETEIVTLILYLVKWLNG